MNYQKLDVKQTRYYANTPDNALAKLMYYLACVFRVVQFDGAERYINYSQYDSLSSEEEKTVLNLVSIFNPKVMVDNYLFLIDQKLIPPNQSNQFFELSDNRLAIPINSEVIIGGESRKILKVMACNEYWLNTYYYNPVQSYNSRPLPILMEDNIIEENIQYLSQNNEDDNDQCGRRLDAYYSFIRITGLWCLCDANFTRKCKRNIACSSLVFSIVFIIIGIVMAAISTMASE